MKQPSQTCENCKFELKGTCDWVGSNYRPIWVVWETPRVEGLRAEDCDTWQPRRK